MKRGDLCTLVSSGDDHVLSWIPGPPQAQITGVHEVGSPCLFMHHEDAPFSVVLINGRLRAVDCSQLFVHGASTNERGEERPT